VIERIHAVALDLSLDPLVTSTDVFVTAVLHVGSKSLSHVLAAIERTKDRLLDVGAASDAARAQIVAAVMDYWAAHPGVAITIVEKLLNYSILSPITVVQWALVSHAGSDGKMVGEALSRAHIYELVFNTVVKVTSRVRHVVAAAKKQPSSDDVDMADATAHPAVDEATRDREVRAMRDLFRAIEDALVGWASGSKDEMIESGDNGGEEDSLARRWGQRWLRVFRRRAAIEEAFLLDAVKDPKGSKPENGSA
jgi:nuclear cap-binding protein subunit 1